MPVISDDLNVSSTPSGATVYLKRFAPEQAVAQKKMAGTTPISHLRIARGEYVMSIEMPGYAPFERTVSSALRRDEDANISSDQYEIHADCRLVKAVDAPDRMVFVPGGDYKLQGWDTPYDGSVRIEDYFIDKFEVSNRQFKEFIDSGGYLNKRFWKYPILRSRKVVDLQEAIAGFKDRTGLPGPRTWSGGTFPAAKDDHPVTDITWYEAAAYASFRAKRLPTIFEWEKAARGGLGRRYRGIMAPWGPFQGDAILSRAIFESSGTAPVDSLEFGMSPYGAYHMAGNVEEWRLNEYQDGFVTAGGSWNDPAYRFGAYDAIPPLLASDTIGFRCARSAVGNSGQGAMRFNEPLKPPSYRPTSESYFQTLLRHYRYDKTPLDPRVVAQKDLPDWRQIDITYNGANQERVTAYLIAPRNRKPPFQVIHYIPRIAFSGVPLLNTFAFRVAPHVRAGRAVFLVSLRGFSERPWPAGRREPEVSSVQFRDQVVQWANDMRRGIDYLETRDNIDVHRIVLWNVSGGMGPLFAAVENRYRTVILMSGGMNDGGPNYIAEANPLNFAGHIRPPKLQFNGRFDEGAGFQLGTEPLYKLLSEPKSQMLYDGGHLPPVELSVKVVNSWLDEMMGSVGSAAVKSR
jgi:formylglycine-generating enzyme required for sulfatase activity